MPVEQFVANSTTVVMTFFSPLEAGRELLVHVFSTTRTDHQPPQRGGPTTSEATFLNFTIHDPVAGVVITTGEGDADINEVFRLHAPGGPTARITGTVPFVNEELNVFPATLDLTVQASGPTTHQVLNERFLEPGETNVRSHISEWRTLATAEGILTYQGTDYPLSTDDAEFLVSRAGSTVVSHGASSTDWLF